MDDIERLHTKIQIEGIEGLILVKKMRIKMLGTNWQLENAIKELEAIAQVLRERIS